ncbi:hypothetical protein [uncultured Methylibium sp.]|uniref:hypothetical protein n=1 Tax=uncultured Methylibium sp. TaxID=381093 RepID=UPI0025E9C918|nr:hypothetical protein [uncultured Methylibium sp.]
MSKTANPPTRVFSTGVVLSLAASAFFFWLWVDLYLRVDFNELGRHYDAEAQVVVTDSAFVWGLPAIGFLLLAAAQIAVRLRRRRADAASQTTPPPPMETRPG